MPEVSSRKTFLHAFALVLGFSMVFTLLGASVGLLGGYFLWDILPSIVRVGSILLIIFALRVARLQWSFLGWAAAAVALAGITYWMDRFQFDQSHRIINAILIGLVVLSGARWEQLVLVVLAVVIGLLSWLTSRSLFLSLRAAETALVVLIVYFGNRTDIFDRELRLDMSSRMGRGGASYWRSGLVGVIFAAGWTPCIGPILSGILLLAADAQTVGLGALLLGTYSLGLGIPFLLAGALFSRLTRVLPRLYRHMPLISLISAVLLISIALLIFTDTLAVLAQYGTFLWSVEEGFAPEVGAGIPLLLAFVAGIISFLSPCVLPLVPAYIGYLSGAALGGASVQGSRQAVAA